MPAWALSRAPLLGPVDRGAMIDAVHHDEVLIVVDLVDDPIGAAPGRSEASQLSLQWATDAIRVLDQGPEHELHDRGRHHRGAGFL